MMTLALGGILGLLPLLLLPVSIHSADIVIPDQEPIQCTTGGSFILPGTCDKYYECKLFRGHLYPEFKDCPHGNNFDDIYSECRPKSIITSPPECIQVHVIADKGPIDASNSNTIAGYQGSVLLGDNNDGTGHGEGVIGKNDTMKNITEELSFCDHVNVVESYSTLVISNPFLDKSFDYQVKYNRDIETYNRDLEKAQNSTTIWRQGDSILSGIRQTYQKANEYKGEFERKLNINQKLIQNLPTQKTDPSETQRLEDEIKALQEEIKKTEAALSLTNVAAVQQYFESVLASKRKEIKRKQQEMETSSKVAHELDERIVFLEYVKNDATEVEVLAIHWQKHMESFFENLLSDLDAFAMHANSTYQGISSLTTEKETIENHLGESTARQVGLDNKKEALNIRLDFLNAENAQNTVQILILTELIADKTDEFNRKREKLCQEGRVVSFIATWAEFELACNKYLANLNIFLDLSEEQTQMRQLRRKGETNRREISQILDQQESITQEISNIFNAEPSYWTRFRQIRNELAMMRIHAGDLKSLHEGAQAAMDSLVKLVDEFTVLQDIFDSYTTQIQAMMTLGHTVQNDEDRSRVNTLIIAGLSDIQLKLHQLDFTGKIHCS